LERAGWSLTSPLFRAAPMVNVCARYSARLDFIQDIDSFYFLAFPPATEQRNNSEKTAA
jgi:hypothetical protein